MAEITERITLGDPGTPVYRSEPHVARYRYTVDFIEDGMTVLDMGCGTGYGDQHLEGARDVSTTSTWEYTYDSLNDVELEEDPRGNFTDYVYDGDGNLIEIIRLDSTPTQVGGWPGGRLRGRTEDLHLRRKGQSSFGDECQGQHNYVRV